PPQRGPPEPRKAPDNTGYTDPSTANAEKPSKDASDKTASDDQSCEPEELAYRHAHDHVRLRWERAAPLGIMRPPCAPVAPPCRARVRARPGTWRRRRPA